MGFPSAIDQGKNTITSKTALAYGVRGYPTTIIIGRDGKVVFNSGSKVGTIDSAEEMMEIMTKTMKPIALANNLAWPPPVSPTADTSNVSKKKMATMKQWLRDMQFARLSHHIEKALAQ